MGEPDGVVLRVESREWNRTDFSRNGSHGRESINLVQMMGILCNEPYLGGVSISNDKEIPTLYVTKSL